MNIQRRIRLATALSFMAVGAIATGDAKAATVNWTGPSHFVSADISFAAFTADTLVSTAGNAYFHTHNTSQPNTMTLSIKLDDVWTPIFSATTSNVGQAADNTLSLILANVTFATGSVSGIMATATGGWNQNFHNWLNQSFTFDTTTVVPLPAALPLFGAGLGIMGLFGWLRRRRATPSFV